MSGLLEAIAITRDSQPMLVRGVVSEVRGMTVLVSRLASPVGAMVRIESEFGRGGESGGGVAGEIVGFSAQHAIVMLLGQAGGIRPGSPVTTTQAVPVARVGASMLGRVVDGMGRAIDGRGVLRGLSVRELSPPPLGALRRAPVRQPLRTGVRVLDLMTPMGKGQRMGVFAGPGVGKSTLMGAIARRSSASVNVIALIGERGREVRDFLEHSLGEQGLARSVVVVATGDESPLMRLHAARLACCCAEHFRDCGLDVMLMMDSITRFAHAQRQVGLAAGEMPATRGYTPSVFAQMALLLERAGSIEGGPNGATGGSITGLYTILVEGDDMTEPVADAARGILDGHVILSRKLAQQGQFPAVDVLDSISRVADDVVSPEHVVARRRIVRTLAAYRDIEELVQIGAYAKGSSPEGDASLVLTPRVRELFRQGEERAPGDTEAVYAQGLAQLRTLAQQADSLAASPAGKGRVQERRG